MTYSHPPVLETALCGACHISRGRAKSVSTRFKGSWHKCTGYQKGENRRKEKVCVRTHPLQSGIAVGDRIPLAVVLGARAVGTRWFATSGTLKLRDLHFRRINTDWFPVL